MNVSIIGYTRNQTKKCYIYAPETPRRHLHTFGEVLSGNQFEAPTRPQPVPICRTRGSQTLASCILHWQ